MSTIPAVDDNMLVPAVPYVILSSIPTNSLAGDVVVKGLSFNQTVSIGIHQHKSKLTQRIRIQ